MKPENAELKKWLGSLALCLGAVFWGTAFAWQRMAAETMMANTINSLRFLLGGMILLVVVVVMQCIRTGRGDTRPVFERLGGKRLLIGGFFTGVATFVASYLQQKGLETVDAGKSGFMTSLYIVLVPIFAMLLKKKTTLVNWIGIAISLCGMFLMCIKGSLTFEMADSAQLAGYGYLIACAIMFAVQILIVEVSIGQSDALAFSCVQELSCGLCAAIPMLLFEKPAFEANILPGLSALLFLGVFSCAIAYTMQVVGQKYVPAQAATLLMSLESVFAAIAGVILLQEMMSIREIIGAAIMFAAVLLVQLYRPRTKKDPS